MTIQQQILTKLSSIERKLQAQSDDWLTAEQIKAEFDLSKKFLQLKRREGKLKNFRCLTSGKNFQYQRSEIEKLFTVIKN